MSLAAQLHADADFSKTVFLVADDKPFYRDMVHTALTRAGAKDVKHAVSIETGIELLNRFGQHIGCVVCDWDIAPSGGLELLRMIRTKALAKTPPRTPVVILTSKADSGAVQAAKALDVNGFAVAPLSLEKLVKTIGNAIARTWTLQAPEIYAAVPRVVPTLVAPEKSSSGRRGVILKEGHGEDGAQDQAPRASVAAGAAAKHFARRSQELKNVHMCLLNEVRPGAILARDLHDRSGHLLLKTGTELKPTLISRLTDVAGGSGESYHVWIGEWDEAP